MIPVSIATSFQQNCRRWLRYLKLPEEFGLLTFNENEGSDFVDNFKYLN